MKFNFIIMKKYILYVACLPLLFPQLMKAQYPIKYPETKKVDTVDTYFGTSVADPYRWLEDDRSEETAAWVKEQNKITNNYLQNIPFINTVKERFTKKIGRAHV